MNFYSKLKVLVLIIYLITIQNQSKANDVSFAVNDSLITLTNNIVVVTFDKTGKIISLSKKGADNMIHAQPSTTIDFVVEGKELIETYGASLLRHKLHQTNNKFTLELVFKVKGPEAEYELTTVHSLTARKALLERTAIVKMVSSDYEKKPVKFEGFIFRLNGVAVGNTDLNTIDVPGPFFPKTFVAPSTPYDSLKNKSISFHSAPDAGFGFLSISNKKENQCLASWMLTSGEVNYSSALRGDGKLISIYHKDLRYNYLKAGLEIKSDIHHIELTNNLQAALSAYRTTISETLPLNKTTANWVKEMVLMEVFPEYFKDGFKGLTAKLPMYKDLGINTIYLMPHWKGGYSPIDLYEVEPSLGTRQDLQAMVKKAHELGMRVLFDMVIHGFNKQSPVIQQHPELFIKDVNGKLALHPTWKSVSADWASPAYQQYMVNVVLHDLKTYDIDGYRVDAASYKGPNWDPTISYPAYRSGSDAPEVMEKMLSAMQKRKPEVVMLSEVFGPVFYTISNLVHDNQTEAPQILLEKMAVGNYNFADYKQHINAVYSMLPEGANRVFFARNHDTSWFYHFNGYTPEFLAMEAVHSFFGIPEIFAGDPKNKPNPDEDPKVYNYYKNLFAARKWFPELIKGEIFLNEANTENKNVITGIRKLKNDASLIVVSASNKPESVAVTISKALTPLNKNLKSIDVQTKEEKNIELKNGTVNLTLHPYQALIIRL